MFLVGLSSYDKCDLDVNEKIHPDGASIEELASIQEHGDELSKPPIIA